MTGTWGAAVRRIVLATGVLVAFGWWQGQILLTLLFGALAYLVWNLVNLYRLDRWVSDPSMPNPPDIAGIWGHVFYRIAAIQRKNRKQKKRMAKLLVEFRKSTEAMPDAAVVLDKHDQITWFNSASRRLLGLSMPRDQGQRIDNMLRTPAFRAYLEERDFSQPLLLASPLHDDIILSARIIPYGKGQRLLLARDVTERARIEQMRKDFVANASHELRTPLTVLSGYLEAMQDDGELAERWAGPVGEMRRQAQRMDKLVTDLLELSRLELADRAEEYSAVDMGALLGLVKQQAQASETPGADISVVTQSETQLLANPSALLSVAQNLVQNALRHTPATGHIKLGWRVADGEGQLWVRDDGCGIEAEHLSRLTERFYRVDSGRTSIQGGTGLGLAIVKHILENHDGRLAIASQPGKGSEFTCHFPASRLLGGEAAGAERDVSVTKM